MPLNDGDFLRYSRQPPHGGDGGFSPAYDSACPARDAEKTSGRKLLVPFATSCRHQVVRHAASQVTTVVETPG
ncbi:hypothetical protein BL250_14660 [Erwinia sp. OLTSP20]|nr:hypothetical protein BV501_16380 [Erwinia sp. OAMSP11]PIJ66882.1 hypothetical protein BK416_17210 [Erwinia sp. OLSSP12]PIJ78994.1 hypothetical protein BLD47_15945 [Erwinia sp. OLCASP19]PIJ79861.1 hypothetical protein BLD46_16455 [Erwinia sp. OLMTSP26]PIJ81807.1 hypothetical protein BLD49_16080 [Erwinia sp. OLMDSP33]PIJ89206.1 hypothetical protein BL249_17185 [Erwinia sp. OLFS4]PIJ90064.1 hypothetical protein BL250_14660 [Erwinia sp. OLTSP20]